MKSAPERPEAPLPFTEEWYEEFKANVEKLEKVRLADARILQDKLRALTEANQRFKEQNVAQRREIKMLLKEIRDMNHSPAEAEDEDD